MAMSHYFEILDAGCTKFNFLNDALTRGVNTNGLLPGKYNLSILEMEVLMLHKSTNAPFRNLE